LGFRVWSGLDSCRDAVYQAINRLDGYKCVRMEDFGARDAPSESVCIDVVRSCEIFVGIIGPRFGSSTGADTFFHSDGV